jgi:hypothetical protein
MAGLSSLQHEEIVRLSPDPGRCDVHARLPGAALCLLAMSAAQAATFSSASYDQKTNELVVTMVYGGTNPNHQFSVQWGTCRPLGNNGNHQIVADVLDSQWDDAAKQQFTTTVRFSLAGVNCLPAAITLRTAPKYEYTLQVP